MKITVLQGSPRKGGNTELLAGAFAKGAEGRHDVKVFDVAFMGIGPCKGCGGCSCGVCAQKDRMEEIYGRLAETDMIVIASPVYFYGVSAQLKAVIDRLHNPVRDSFPIVKAALMLVGGSSKPWVFDAVIHQYELCLKYFGIEDMGRICQGGVREPGEITGTGALERAHVLGAGL